MPAADPLTNLLITLVRLGIRLQPEGDRFRYFGAVDDDLLARLRAHKPELLRLLAEAGRELDPDPGHGTPASPPTPAPVYSPWEHRLLAKVSENPELLTWVTAMKAAWPGSTLQAVRMPRDRLADLIRDARGRGDREQAEDLRERWQERAAIMEHDGCMARPQAEALAVAEAPVYI
jgi:hypothetical protein